MSSLVGDELDAFAARQDEYTQAIRDEAAAEERLRWAEICERLVPIEKDLARQAALEEGGERTECFRLGCGNALSVLSKALRANDPSKLG